MYCAAQIGESTVVLEGLCTHRRRSTFGFPRTSQGHVLPTVDPRVGFQSPVSELCRITRVSCPSSYSLKICAIALAIFELVRRSESSQACSSMIKTMRSSLFASFLLLVGVLRTRRSSFFRGLCISDCSYILSCVLPLGGVE